jgi:tetratricopeptide (TPR) repeat protein
MGSRSIWFRFIADVWRSIWFRSIAFVMISAAAGARVWFGSGWRPHLLGLASITAAAVALWRARIGAWPAARHLIDWTFAAEVFAAYAVLGLIIQAYRGRGRLVIITTINHAGDDYSPQVAGLSVDLASALAQLSELYRTIDEANPPSASREITGLQVGVDDPGAQIADVVGEDSKVKLGPLDLPLRPLVAALRRLGSHRRLSSSLHHNGNQLTLLADLPGVAGGNWRVERDLSALPASGDPKRILGEMKEELAYRIFTAIVPTGSREWRAVRDFSEGLRAYRAVLTTKIDNDLNLGRAEACFLNARSLDLRFARCTYNLGVVYNRKGNAMAAKAAFERAITDEPAHADAAYALSVIYHQAGVYGLALEFADRAITHREGDARAWNMKGWIRRRLHPNPESADAWRLSLPFRETAAAFAWLDLCMATWRRQGLDASRSAIVAPFTNLAVARWHLGDHAETQRILRQALRPGPQADLYLALGNALRGRADSAPARPSAAAQAFSLAACFAGTAQDRASNQSCVAEACASVPASRPEAVRLCRDALDSPSTLSGEAVSKFKAASRALDDAQLVSDFDLIEKVQKTLAPIADESDAKRVARLDDVREEMIGSKAGGGEDVGGIEAWALACLEIEISIVLLSGQPGAEALGKAADLLRIGIDRLQRLFPRDERLGQANERLAEAFRLSSALVQALAPAGGSVNFDPFSAAAQLQLGAVQTALSDYDVGLASLRKSVASDPTNRETLGFLATNFWNRGVALSNSEDRASAFRTVIKTFSEAASLTVDDRARGELHFWLGRFQGELKDYDPSALNYGMALALDAFRVECRLYLGWEALEKGRFDVAEDNLFETLRELLRLRRAEAPNSGTLWWRQPRRFSDGDIAPGYFLLNTGLILALVFTDKGGDVERAGRALRFVNRRYSLLGERPSAAEDVARRAFDARRREILARYQDYAGWVRRLEGRGEEALAHLQQSVRIRETPESLCHMARLYLDKALLDSARHCRDRARATDTRGVFTQVIDNLELEASRIEAAGRPAAKAVVPAQAAQA